MSRPGHCSRTDEYFGVHEFVDETGAEELERRFFAVYMKGLKFRKFDHEGANQEDGEYGTTNNVRICYLDITARPDIPAPDDFVTTDSLYVHGSSEFNIVTDGTRDTNHTVFMQSDIFSIDKCYSRGYEFDDDNDGDESPEVDQATKLRNVKIIDTDFAENKTINFELTRKLVRKKGALAKMFGSGFPKRYDGGKPLDGEDHSVAICCYKPEDGRVGKVLNELWRPADGEVEDWYTLMKLFGEIRPCEITKKADGRYRRVDEYFLEKIYGIPDMSSPIVQKVLDKCQTIMSQFEQYDSNVQEVNVEDFLAMMAERESEGPDEANPE